VRRLLKKAEKASAEAGRKKRGAVGRGGLQKKRWKQRLTLLHEALEKNCGSQIREDAIASLRTFRTTYRRNQDGRAQRAGGKRGSERKGLNREKKGKELGRKPSLVCSE